MAPETDYKQLKPCFTCGSTDNPKSKKGTICKPCYVKKSTVWYKNNGEKWRLNQLKVKYGITKQEYLALVEEQGNKCGICGSPETAIGRSGKVKNLAVDHCHETGKVRGLLCQGCNTALGNIKENKDILIKMMQYLEKHQ